MSQWTYFDKDGSYGDAKDLIFVETSSFSESEWFELGCIDCVQEGAIAIAKSRNALIFSIAYEQDEKTSSES